MDNHIEQAFDTYFKKSPSGDSDLYSKDNNILTHIDTKTEREKKARPNKYLASSGNISSLNEFGELFRVILNAAWGIEWGEIKPEIEKTSSIDSLKLPLILYDMNIREASEKMAIKPILTETIIDDNNGEATQVYRQWFDCVVEFNFIGRNSLESVRIMEDFELLVTSYSSYLKKLGVSEIFFLKEIPSETSVKYIPHLPMRTIMYFVRLEKIYKVKESLISKINIEVDDFIKKRQLDTSEKIHSSDDIYITNEINYNL